LPGWLQISISTILTEVINLKRRRPMPEFDSKKPLGPVKINDKASRVVTITGQDLPGKDTGTKYGLPNSWFSTEY
jgi:hypothetical protein